MSTKSTLAHDDSFHFYQEVMDDDHVYLELRTNEFEAGHGRVMLPIPLYIWETIRHLGAADLSLVDQTDEELLRTVQAEVDERIAEYVASESANPGSAGLMRFVGSFAYGPADLPRDEQIKRGMRCFIEQRRRQSELRDAVEAIRKRSAGA